MQIYQRLTPIHAPQGSAVALGYFDGVHCGHRAVLGAAVECARAGGLTAAAFTFELPASSTLKGGRILSLPQKHARVASLGIEEYQEAPFDEFRALTPEDFVQKVLVGCFNAKQLFCGDNFTFGARAAGNVERLRELCAPLGIGVHIVPMAQYGGQTVSSTRIRAALEEGRLDDANAMLGTPYAIDWPVVHGKGIGSGKLGTQPLKCSCAFVRHNLQCIRQCCHHMGRNGAQNIGRNQKPRVFPPLEGVLWQFPGQCKKQGSCKPIYVR